ncbi:MAG: CvpA family protein [Phycisphaerales bacterium]|nr:CvpA family protein [Phycisphaerales bacterium]
MLISLVFVVLIFAIAYFQASQGWYSAMIMTVLTICCAAAAFGTYEWVATHFVAPYWKPNFAHPIALAALFGVPLIILRLVFDRVLRRTCLLPLMVDRAGGGVCGIVTAMIMVGVLATATEMIPFQNGSILGFSRFPVGETPAASEGAGEPSADQGDLWLMPDRFAAGLATNLSKWVFSGGAALYDDHPDLISEIGWNNAVPAEVSRYAPPGSVFVAGTELIPTVFRLVPGPDPKNTPPTYEPIDPRKPDKDVPEGYELRMVRVKLDNKARDEHKSHLFTLRQFRIVGNRLDTSALSQYHAVAIQQEDAADPVNRHIRFKKAGKVDKPVVDELYAPRSGDTVEVVFEVPKKFQPTILAYKRGAQTPIAFEKQAAGGAEGSRDQVGSVTTTPPSGTPQTGGNATAESKPPTGSVREAPGDGRGGNIRGIATKVGGSFFGDRMPMELTKYRADNAEIERGALVGGQLVAEVDKQTGGADPPVSKFAVPEDKRLLQLNVAKLQTRSGLGQAINFAVSTVQNYFVQDANGNRYEVVGKYALADVNGTKFIEIQYYSQKTGTIGQLGKFDRIREKELKPDDQFVLLFLVDPGTHITKFSTGGEATRADDLTVENLVAPK